MNTTSPLPRLVTKAHVRVASYNVLSSALCSPSYFVTVPERECSPRYRLEVLERKLEGETQRGSVIALQELSLAWTGKLHAFFALRGYTLVASNYGTRFNGYMG